MSLAGYITKDEIIRTDGSCGGTYNFVICSGLDIKQHRITGSGCTWAESHGSVTQQFNNQFNSNPTGIGQFGYTYCSLGEVSGVSWPCPSGFILEGVVSREDCECEGADCTDVSGCIEVGDGGCYSIEAYLDWDKPDPSSEAVVLFIQSDVANDNVVLFIESDVVDDNVVLFIESDVTDESDDVVDSSPSNHSITKVGHTHHEREESKFGSSSIYFDGAGDHLSVGDANSSDWDFGSEDWTMEAWVRPTISYSVIIGKWLTTGGSDNSFVISTDINNKVKGFFQNDCTATDHGVVLQGTIALTLDDRFYHVAVKRVGDSIQLYIDGVFDTSVAFTGSLCTSTQSLQIGDFGNWDNSIQIPKEYQGYIDNVKITRASSGSSDIVDSSPSNHSITKVGDTHHATAQKKFGSSSIYFDGSGDHLSVGDADSPDWDFGDEDWTMEAWVRPTVSYGTIMGKWNTAGSEEAGIGDNSFVFWVDLTTNKIKGYFQNDCNTLGYGTILLGTIALTLDDSFYHVVVKRVGDSIKLYINGVFDTSVAFTGSLCTSTLPLMIGDFYPPVSSTQTPREYKGYIDNVKITRVGSSGSDDIVDSSPSNHSITTVGDTHHATAQKKFGSSSIYFDGYGDWLSVPDEDWDFGDEDFTVECFFYVETLANDFIPSPGSVGLIASVEDSAGTADNGWALGYNEDGSIFFNVHVSEASTVISLNKSNVIQEGQWYHIVAQRRGSSATLWLDGENVDSASFDGDINYGHGLAVGRFYTDWDSYYHKGYIDNVKITKMSSGTCEDLCDPYDPNPSGCPADMDLYVKVGSGCKDAGGSTVYYDNMAVNGDNMLSGQWYGSLNQDSNPECACEPTGAEYITGGVYDEDRDFYAWFSQYSDCANDLVGDKIRSYFKVINHCDKNLTIYITPSGADAMSVLNCPPYGEAIYSEVSHAGYNTGPIPNFADNYVSSQVKLNPTKISVRDTHDELTYPECADECQPSGTTEDKYRAIYDFDSGVVNKMWEVNCDTVNSFSALSETSGILNVGGFSIEECACACPPGTEACTWYPPTTGADGEVYGGFWACPDWSSTCASGQSCCDLTPTNKASVSVTFGAAQTGVTVDVPYVFYGTGIYTGNCIAKIENQKTKECWTSSNSAHAPSDYWCDKECTGINPPQNSIAYGGFAEVYFNKAQSAATIDCTGWTDNVGIPRDCCNVAVIDTYPSGHPAHTLGGEHPGGTGYSPSGDYMNLLNMQVGQTITPIYEAFVTGCLLRSGDNGEYLMSFPDNRTFTLNHTGTNACEDQDDFGNIIGKVYTLTLNSTGTPTEFE